MLILFVGTHPFHYFVFAYIFCFSFGLNTYGYGNDYLQILEDKPDHSRWSLKYEVFGRNVEFSWLARNMTVSMRYDKAAISLGVNVQSQ